MPVDLLGELLGVEMLLSGVIAIFFCRYLKMVNVDGNDACGLVGGTPWGGNVD